LNYQLDIKDIKDRIILSFTTGSKRLDEFLTGGYKLGTINEIYGEFGTGKTRFLHQIAYLFCLQKNNYTYFIDNEGTFRPEILLNLSVRYGGNIKEILNRIYVSKPLNEKQFLETLERLENIKDSLIIIDTLTTHLRLLQNKFYEIELKKVLRKLLIMASKNSCIIFSNQVRFDEKGENNITPLGGSAVNEIINTKIKLENEGNRIRCIIENYNAKRKYAITYLMITNNGIISVDE